MPADLEPDADDPDVVIVWHAVEERPIAAGVGGWSVCREGHAYHSSAVSFRRTENVAPPSMRQYGY
jgi:hypothetical protein